MVSELVASPVYPNTPRQCMRLNNFAYTIPDNTGEKRFGIRMWTYFIAEETGSYKFKALCLHYCQLAIVVNGVRIEVIDLTTQVTNPTRWNR